MKKLILIFLILFSYAFYANGQSGVAAQQKIIDTPKTIKATDIEHVFVQGGTYRYADFADPSKSIQVTVNSFYISKYEITQKQWKAVMHENHSLYSGCDNCPVENVTWDEVQEFINRLNELIVKHYRLPTEAEWEYAAMGGIYSQHHLYSGSNNIDEVAWYSGNSNRTHIAGTKKPNELGIYDMMGNVSEWCSDWVGSIKKMPTDTNNPKGPSDGYTKVIRGGSFASSLSGDISDLKLHFNSSANPNIHNERIGFRLVIDHE